MNGVIPVTMKPVPFQVHSFNFFIRNLPAGRVFPTIQTAGNLEPFGGRCARDQIDYKRNGTTTLFAALELAEGKVIGQCYARHRHQEFLKFLKRLDFEFPVQIKLHVVMDNYGTHKHPKVQSWLQRHPRFVPHFIPTSSSWLNLVERWFGELTGKSIRRGAFVSVDDLIASIDEYLA